MPPTISHRVGRRTGAVACCITLLTACGDQVNHAWEVAAQGVYAGALAPRSGFALVGSLNHGGSLWSIPAGERLFNWNHASGEFSDLVAAAISDDGQRAATTDPRTMVLWDTATGASLGFWTTPAAVLDLALTPRGDQILMGMQDHSAVLFDAASGAHVQTLLHDGAVNTVSVDASGERALTGSADNTAVLWDLTTGQAIRRLAHTNPVRVAELSASAKYALTAVQSEAVALWDLQSGSRVAVLQDRNQGVMSAAFAADDSTLLIGYVNRRIELWDVATARLRRSWNPPGKSFWRANGRAVLAVAFGASGYFVMLGDGSVVELS